MLVPVKFIGLSADASALVETFRESPEQLESDIIEIALRKLRPAAETVGATPRGPIGCDLGAGIELQQDEQIFCYLRRREAGKAGKQPDGVAVARDGALFVEGHRVEPQRGAWLHAALKVVQKKSHDISKKTGDAKSLNAWIHWFVRRGNELIAVGSLRNRVSQRGTRRVLTAEELGL